jgi:hypothetical protein
VRGHFFVFSHLTRWMKSESASEVPCCCQCPQQRTIPLQLLAVAIVALAATNMATGYIGPVWNPDRGWPLWPNTWPRQPQPSFWGAQSYVCFPISAGPSPLEAVFVSWTRNGLGSNYCLRARGETGQESAAPAEPRRNEIPPGWPNGALKPSLVRLSWSSRKQSGPAISAGYGPKAEPGFQTGP